MSNFNLLDDAWISVQDLDTGEFIRVGARAALVQAHRWRLAESNADSSYPVVFKFLVALWAATGACPDSDAGWRAAWNCSRLPGEAINAYCDKWRDRFYILDESYPFMQRTDLVSPTREAATLRVGYFMSANGRNLGFDGEAARTQFTVRDSVVPLLRAHAMDTAGIKTGLPGNRSGKTYGAHTGVLGGTTQVFVRGRNLRDDLLLGLPPYARTDGDSPAWERVPKPSGIATRVPSGMLDVLTWQSRSIRVFADDDGMVTGVAWHDGDRVDPGVSIAEFDPCSAWNRGTGRRQSFCASGSGLADTAVFVSSMVPWRADDFDLDLGASPPDSSSGKACVSSVVDNVVAMADTIGVVPLWMQFHTVSYGTQSAIVDDVDYVSGDARGVAVGSGRVWADPLRRAIVGMMAAWFPRARGSAYKALQSSQSASLRRIGDKVPKPVLPRDQWDQMIHALDSDDSQTWRKYADKIIRDSAGLVQEFLEGHVAGNLKHAHDLWRTRANVFGARSRWMEAVRELCDQHVLTIDVHDSDDVFPLWMHVGDAVGETRRRRGVSLSQLSAGVGEAILDAISRGATIGTAAATYHLMPQTLSSIAKWNVQWREALDAALMAGRDPDIPHGPNSYRMYGCRCPQCRYAHHGRKNIPQGESAHE